MSKDIQKETSVSTVVTAAFIGGLAGALVGLLVAPKSGRELREEISGKAQATWRDLEELSQEKAEMLETVRAEVSREGKRLINDLQTLIQELQHSSGQKIEVAADQGEAD